MARSPLGTVAVLGVVSVIAMSAMWLFSLRQVTDTSAAEGARDVDASLGRSLEAGQATRVTMSRSGSGLDAPRRYVVHYRPAAEVGASGEALAELARRVAGIVARHINAPRAEVTIDCIAELTGGSAPPVSFRRVAGEPGAADEVTPIASEPAGSPDRDAGSNGGGRR